MPIRQLPPLLVSQIAAGEVIERPASVVKELVENSLDAGAGRIDVTVEDGGRQLIRISDDGWGIDRSELKLALTPHATSKIAASDDLAAIATLGFRGEALASIASIARLRVTSRPREGQDGGHLIEAQADHIGEPVPASAAPGTIVEVRDLFFNTPARRKFMRTAATEFGHLADMVSRLAMAWPQVAFCLTHSDRPALELPAGQTRRQRCVAVLGQDLDEALIEFEDQAPFTGQSPTATTRGRLWGLAALPAVARSSAKSQYIFLNRRPVRDRNIAHALRQAYQGLIPHDRYPVAVVFIEADPAAVDVNVHPTKAEVRFGEPGRIHGLVLTAIRQRLLGSDLTPQVAVADHDLPLTAGGAHTTAPQSVSDFVDYFKRMDPTQKGFVYQQVKQALAQDDPQAVGDDAPDAPDEPVLPMAPRLADVGVLQVHNSYLVTQDDNGLLIVDQHALHERVMFEELRHRVLDQNKSLESQRLLMPATLTVTATQTALLEDLQPLLARIGIEAELMGPQTIGIHAFASFLFDRQVDPIDFLEMLLERAEQGQLGPVDAGGASADALDEAVLHNVLDMMACKAAVRAGDHMNQQELVQLLAKREQIERASNCPHGRPTSVRLTLRDLEKHFKRT